MKRALVVSLAINFVAAVFVLERATSPGWREQVLIRSGLAKTPWKPHPEYTQRAQRLQATPRAPGGPTWAGDSMVELAPVAGILAGVHNLGIGGETSAGLLFRLEGLLAERPRELVVLIGTNDITRGIAEWDTLENVREIVRRASAATRLHVVGILPRPPGWAPERVAPLNARMREIVLEYGADWIDLSEAFRGPDGALAEEYRADAVHLTPAGYARMVALVQATMRRA